MRSFPSALCGVVLLATAACRESRPPNVPRADTVVVGRSPEKGQHREPASEEAVQIPIGRDDATRGMREAPVTIVMASGFVCPDCAPLEKTMTLLRNQYGDALRIVWKHHPVGSPYGEYAAEVGEGVRATKGDLAFWRYHDIVCSRQAELPIDVSAMDKILGWAIEVGADEAALHEGIAAQSWTPKVEQDSELVNRLGAYGMPVVWLNGVKVDAAAPLATFQAIIERERSEAKALSRRGIAPDEIYRERVAANIEVAPNPEPSPHAADDTTLWKVLVDASPIRGPAAAPITLVQFGDFESPYCKSVETVLGQLRLHYGPKLRIVWKDMPLSTHPRARPAAEIARAVRARRGDTGFWFAHDQLLDSAPSLEDSNLEAIARSAGLDVKIITNVLTNAPYEKGIDVDVTAGESIRVDGTPDFFINGRHLAGAQPFEAFTKIIDEELARFGAQKTAAKDYYDQVMAAAKVAPPQPTSVAPKPAIIRRR